MKRTPPSAGSIWPKRPKWRSTCQAIRSEIQMVAVSSMSPYCHSARFA
jgi:hypothetical protein